MNSCWTTWKLNFDNSFTLFMSLTDFFFSQTLIKTVDPVILQSPSLPLLARALPTIQLDQEKFRLSGVLSLL